MLCIYTLLVNRKLTYTQFHFFVISDQVKMTRSENVPAIKPPIISFAHYSQTPLNQGSHHSPYPSDAAASLILLAELKKKSSQIFSGRALFFCGPPGDENGLCRLLLKICCKVDKSVWRLFSSFLTALNISREAASRWPSDNYSSNSCTDDLTSSTRSAYSARVFS